MRRVGKVVRGWGGGKERVEWLWREMLGKVVEMKKGVRIEGEKSWMNVKENMERVVGGWKMWDMGRGWMWGERVGRGGEEGG